MLSNVVVIALRKREELHLHIFIGSTHMYSSNQLVLFLAPQPDQAVFCSSPPGEAAPSEVSQAHVIVMWVGVDPSTWSIPELKAFLRKRCVSIELMIEKVELVNEVRKQIDAEEATDSTIGAKMIKSEFLQRMRHRFGDLFSHSLFEAEWQKHELKRAQISEKERVRAERLCAEACERGERKAIHHLRRIGLKIGETQSLRGLPHNPVIQVDMEDESAIVKNAPLQYLASNGSVVAINEIKPFRVDPDVACNVVMKLELSYLVWLK